jgi:hypothetical protein
LPISGELGARAFSIEKARPSAAGVASEWASNRTDVLARPTGFERADAINIRILIEGARIGLLAEGA